MKVEITRRSLLLPGPAIGAVAWRPLMAAGNRHVLGDTFNVACIRSISRRVLD